MATNQEQKNKDVRKKLLNRGKNRPHRMNFLLCYDLFLAAFKSKMQFSTYRTYEVAKRLFVRYIGERKFFDFNELHQNFLLDLKTWMKTAKARPYKDLTIKVYMSIYKKICIYAHRKYGIRYNYNFNFQWLENDSPQIKARHAFTNDTMPSIAPEELRQMFRIHPLLAAFEGYVNRHTAPPVDSRKKVDPKK